MKYLAIVLIVVLLLGGMMFVSARNDMAVKNEAISAQWSQVDVVLQRRADLIPNLVATVKGFAAQEQSVIDSVTSARAALVGAKTPAERIQANSTLDTALGRLLVVVENYPQLKSDQNFLRLQDELSRSENRIAVERRKYNEVVQAYNTTIVQFPNSVFASIAGFARKDEYIKADPGAKAPPKVQF